MYFIGLTFHQNFVQFKKIDSFRKRFDPHYSLCKSLQMTVLPPFELRSPRDEKTVIAALEEELDSFFHGQRVPFKVDFNELDIISGPKKIICLGPSIPCDISFAQETLADILNHYEVRFKRKGMRFYESVLPIGRSLDNRQLQLAIEQAKEEFSFPMSLYLSSITLFQKCPRYWPVIKRLHHFTSDIYELRPDELILAKEGANC